MQRRHTRRCVKEALTFAACAGLNRPKQKNVMNVIEYNLEAFRHNFFCVWLPLQAPPVVEWDSRVPLCWTRVEVDWEHAMHTAIESEITQEPYLRTSCASVDGSVCTEEVDNDMLSCGSGGGIAAAVVDGRHNPHDNI